MVVKLDGAAGGRDLAKGLADLVADGDQPTVEVQPTWVPKPGSARALPEMMGTTQSVISRLEGGGGARSRIDTLARAVTALDRHLVVSFPEDAPAKLKDAVQVARPTSRRT